MTVQSEAQKPNSGEIRETVWMKTRQELQSDLKNMVNRPESSDVVFICNDGVGVHACRLLLASRSAVFKGMLSNGMMESNMLEIPLPMFSSSAMLSVMEYLYTGALETFSPSWKMGFEIVCAAQFFIIPALETFAEDFLYEYFDADTEKSALAEMLSVALEFEETWEDKELILRELVDFIGSDWSDEACCRKLSRKAVEHILSTSKRGCQVQQNGPLVEEYLNFRKVVLWHIYHAMPFGTAEAKSALENILPGEDKPSLLRIRKILEIPVDIDCFLSNAATAVDIFDSSAALNGLLGTSICKDSLVQLLRHINLSLIPAPLLVKVIHPLTIVPSHEILKAIVHFAVQRRTLPFIGNTVHPWRRIVRDEYCALAKVGMRKEWGLLSLHRCGSVMCMNGLFGSSRMMLFASRWDSFLYLTDIWVTLMKQ